MEIQSIGFGTWQMKGQECVQAVKNAVDIGYRLVDTAEMYGNEKEVGKGIEGFRDKIFLTSKLWFENFHNAEESLDASLEKLNTDYLDLYLLHWPKEGYDMRKTLKAMRKALDEGKIKQFGVSNFTIPHLQEFIPLAEEYGVKVEANQVEFHPLLYQKELLDYCNKHGIQVIAYSPLARGKVFDNETLKEIGKKHGKTPGQVSIRWLMDKGIVPIPKASKRGHAEQNFDIDFTLSDEDIRRIDNINAWERIINPDFAEFWKDK